MGSSDQDLLGQAAGGNGQALAELLEEHTPSVRRQLMGRIPRRWQALLSVEDVLQQTYTDAFLSIDRFDPEGEASFPSWLAVLARYNLVDALRMLEADKRGKHHRRIQPEAREDSFVAFYELLSAGGTTPSRHVARGEAGSVLRRAIQELSETYRQVAQMYDIEGRPVAEVASALNRSTGAIYMIRARAHRRLCELMGNESKYFSKV